MLALAEGKKAEGKAGGEDQEWMTLEEVAARLRCSTDSIRRYVLKKKGTGIIWMKQPFKRGSLLARRDTVDAYIEKLHSVKMPMIRVRL